MSAEKAAKSTLFPHHAIFHKSSYDSLHILYLCIWARHWDWCHKSNRWPMLSHGQSRRSSISGFPLKKHSVSNVSWRGLNYSMDVPTTLLQSRQSSIVTLQLNRINSIHWLYCYVVKCNFVKKGSLGVNYYLCNAHYSGLLWDSAYVCTSVTY